ncbi:olfactory receptor 2A12-like [Chanos chanos]|uniref:Olfactory receptor n=1 Tax=Chanos chanos TaxID=29144 RepID=A0A6J2WXA5_CHACN|nr:olfactory receptor 2A12-like [Chanos chanos]
MLKENGTTTITEFIIVGFPGLHSDYYGLVSVTLFLIYVTSVTGNLLLMGLFVFSRSFRKPMYIIMVSLALADISFCTVTLPKIIARYWFDAGAIPFQVCFFQRYLVHYFGTLTSFIMMIMALDRYVAICHPLRYPSMMTNRIMAILNVLAWVFAVVPPTITTVQAYELPYCGPNRIIHCYCESISISALACAGSSVHRVVSLSTALLVLLGPLSFIIFSYGCIIVSVLRIASSHGRWKTFSTCSSQLSIISLYYVPRCFVYITALGGFKMSADFRILLVLFYSIFPPLVNPFIYCFRNQEIRQIFLRCC